MANNDKRLLLEYGHLYTPTNNDQRVMKKMNELDKNKFESSMFLLRKQTEFARQAERNHTLISQHEARSGPYEETIFNKTKMKNMTNREKKEYLMKQRLASAIKARNRREAAQRPQTASETKHATLYELVEDIAKTDATFTRIIMSQLSDRDLFKKLIIEDTISNLNVGDDKFKFIKEYLKVRLKPTAPPEFDKNYEYQILLQLSNISNDDQLEELKQDRVSIRGQYNSILANSLKKTTGLGATLKGFFGKKGGSQKARRQTQRQRRQRKQKKTRKRFHK